MLLSELLFESRQIAIAKKAFASLSNEAKNAIDAWESSNWIGGALEQHIKANDAVAQEIDRAFQPVRDSIPGDTVMLYRGIQHSDEEHTRHLKNRILESWTSDRNVAEYFAGLRTDQNKQGRSRIVNIPPKAEVDKAIAQYNAKGYTTFGGYYFLKNKQHPKYYNIYDRYRQFVTDGDNIERQLTHWYDDYAEINRERSERGHVVEKAINKNRIVWLTNNLNSKEYIVRVA